MSADVPAAQRLPLGLLGAAGFFVMANMRITDPLLPAIADDLGASVADTAVVVTSYALAYGVLQIVYGPLGDRVGKLKVITGALVLAAVATALCAAATDLAMLSVARFASGLTSAAVVPLTLALIGDRVPYADRQATIGRYLGALMMGQILGGSLAGVLTEQFGWRAVFVVLGSVALAASVLLARVAATGAPPPPAPATLSSLVPGVPQARLLRMRAPRLLMIAVFAEGFFFYGALAYQGAALRSHLGLGYLAIGVILAGFGLGGLVYSRMVGWLVRRLGERRMIAFGALGLSALFVAFAIAPHWSLAAASLVALGFCFYMLHNTFQTLATELAPGSRGVALSLFVFTLFLGQGLGVAVLGRVVEHAGYVALYGIAAVGIAALGLWFQSRLADVKAPRA